jgi:phosphomannomutase
MEFTLATDGDGTRLAVVESGFDGLEVSADERTAIFADHTRGWPKELGELVDYVIGATAGER